MFLLIQCLWICSNSCPLNLLLVRIQQAEIIILMRLIQGRNNMTRVRVKPRSCDQGRRDNDAFALSTMLPTISKLLLFKLFHLQFSNTASGPVDGAFVTETVRFSSILGSVKPTTINSSIHSFPS